MLMIYKIVYKVYNNGLLTLIKSFRNYLSTWKDLLMICKIIYKVRDNGLLNIYGSLWIIMH